jgi:polysaccharide deacetylase 2 family uncharacterized protein YibQ
MKRLRVAVLRRWARPFLRRRSRGTLRLAGIALVILAIGVALGIGLGGRYPAPGRPGVQVPIAQAPAPRTTVPAIPPVPPPRVAGPARPERHDEPQQTVLAAPRPPAPPVAERPAPAEPPALTGEPPWLRYAVAPPPTAGKALVAVVIDDVGLDKKGAEEAIRLAAPLTLSFMTYANDLSRLTTEAHAAGHELLLHVPMEALDSRQDAGPNVLQVGLSRDEVVRRLRWDFERMSGYVGINNHMGSRFTSSIESMTPVIEEVKARGLLFLDSRTAPTTVGDQLARQMGVPHAARDVFLDYEIGGAAIRARLAEVEQVAHHRGSAIAIGHPHEATLEALADWLPKLSAKGLVLVPLSTVVRQRGATG